MPWFKVDDKLHDHRKTRKAGVAAMGLWALAGSWCADTLSDGFIPDDVAARWDRGYRKLAARLVDAGFWTVAEKDGEPGWQFHDWNAPGMQPTADSVRTERAAAAERQRRAREAAKQRRDAERAALDTVTDVSRRDSRDGDGVSHGPPGPTRPDPTQRGGTSSASSMERPSAFCPRHPNGTDAPCGPCGIARRAHLAWQKPTPMPPHISELRAAGVIR